MFQPVTPKQCLHSLNMFVAAFIAIPSTVRRLNVFPLTACSASTDRHLVATYTR